MVKSSNTIKDKNTKNKIILAAKKIFAEKGYEASSMSKIAEAAGLDKSSLYYFFKDKEDLFSFVTLDIWNELGKIADMLNNPPPSQTPAQSLSATCQKFIKISENAGLSMTRMELPKTETSVFKEIIGIMNSMEKNITKFLTQNSVTDPKTAYSIISNSIHAYVLHCRTGKFQPPAKKYCNYLTSLFISDVGRAALLARQASLRSLNTGLGTLHNLPR